MHKKLTSGTLNEIASTAAMAPNRFVTPLTAIAAVRSGMHSGTEFVLSLMDVNEEIKKARGVQSALQARLEKVDTRLGELNVKTFGVP